jgi:hypothetical protein
VSRRTEYFHVSSASVKRTDGTYSARPRIAMADIKGTAQGAYTS